MPLLRNGRPVPGDSLIHLDDDAPLPIDGAGITLPLARFLALDATEPGSIWSVSIAPADDPATLHGALQRLDVVVIDFPVFTDGRGYSHARTLRRLGFDGEIRATGDIRLDQLRLLQQVGIDGAQLSAPIDVHALEAIAERFPGTYQPSYRASARPDGSTGDSGAI